MPDNLTQVSLNAKKLEYKLAKLKLELELYNIQVWDEILSDTSQNKEDKT